MDEADHMNHTNQTLDIVTSSAITNSSSEIAGGFCGAEFMKFGLVSTVTCSIGILTNMLIVLVLARKNMPRSPANAIVTSIALADLLFLISTLTFHSISYDVFHVDICVRYSYVMQMLLLITVRCALVSSRVSVMLTLLLGVWRYIAVTYPLKAQSWCSLRRTVVAIVACYIFVPISNIVLFLSTTVGTRDITFSGCDVDVYFVKQTEMFESYFDSIFDNIGLWLFTALYKIVLPLVMIIISIILMRALYSSSRQRSELTNNSTSVDRSHERTTRTLLAVLILFVVTELPAGIFLLLTAVLGNGFYDTCYIKFVEINDLLEILGGSLNFIFYVTMSKQFRTTFVAMFAAATSKQQEVPITMMDMA